ncbi:DUF3048 domain-containing protein [Lentibacillus sediminis]|uniref:DUF3048 domain-containing protein n=1 Tax=Lentibacillus sediminis TaxID=1940529 RepID=UPI000C1C1495|nr:DUF3048 domain-containing protein [Lentibacillus sediminis]
MRKLILGMLAAVLLLAGCAGEEKVARENPLKEPGVEIKEEAPVVQVAEEATAEDTEESGPVYPLTGIEADGDLSNNRIISVMVNNHTSARPQSGLSQADMVFEILAEGSITRFLALYQSELPEEIGPVRSAREYYFELANGYNALYVYHGAAGFVNDMIAERGIPHLDGAIYDNNGTLFQRESFRQAPHNSYLQVDGVYPAAEEKGYATSADMEPLPFLTAEETGNLSGDPANHVEVVYDDSPMEIVEFFYEADTGKYIRYNDGEETVELESGEPIQVDNVFIVESPHQIIDDAGRRAIDLVSGGNGYLIQEGIVREVQWENRDGRIIPVIDGEPAGFVPGKTWINVVPSSPGIGQSVTISK